MKYVCMDVLMMMMMMMNFISVSSLLAGHEGLIMGDTKLKYYKHYWLI